MYHKCGWEESVQHFQFKKRWEPLHLYLAPSNEILEIFELESHPKSEERQYFHVKKDNEIVLCSEVIRYCMCLYLCIIK